MFLTKLKLTAAVVLAFGLTGAGTGVALRSTAAVAGDGAVAQAAPPKAAEPPVLSKSDLDRTIDLMKQARDTLKGELNQAEKAYLEFRQSSPAFAASSNQLQNRITALMTSLDQYAVRRVEMQAQVDALEGALRSGEDPSVLLLMIQRNGTSPSALRDALPDDRRAKATAVELVQLHVATLKKDLKVLQAQEQGVRQLADERRTMLQGAFNYEAQLEQLTGNVKTQKELYNVLVRKLSELSLLRAQQRPNP